MKNRFKHFFKENSSSIKKIIGLLVVFGLFKSIAFFAPIGLAHVLNSESLFGQFEYVLNLGLMLTSIFSAGLVGAYGFFILKNKKIELIPVFHVHFLALTTIVSILTILDTELLANDYFGAVILGLALADQILIAGILKGTGRNNLAVIIDTGLYIVLAIMVILIAAQMLYFSQKLWHAAILLTLIVTSIFYHLPRCKNIFSIDSRTILGIYQFGGLVLLTGPLLVLLSNSTRLYIEYFSDFSSVGIYSINFRIAALVLIFYRVAGILLFRSFFVSDHEVLDKRYSSLILGLLFFNLISFLILIFLNQLFNPELPNSLSIDWKLYLICLFQTTFWINISLFESAFQRENQLKKFILLLLVSCGILVGVFFTLDLFDLLTLKTIVVLNSLIIFLVFYGQQFLLKRINIEYPKTMKIHTLTGALFGISVLLIYFL